MGSTIKRRLYLIAITVVGCAAIEGVLLNGRSLRLSPMVQTAGQVLLLTLLIVGGVGVVALGSVLRRAFDVVGRTIEKLVSQESASRAADGGEVDCDLVPAGISGPLAGVAERVGSLTRQRDEQKLAARLAQKRARHLEAVLRGLPGAVLVIDAMDRVVMANEAAARWFRLEPSHNMAVPLDECIADRSLCDLLRGAHGLPASKEFEHSIEGPEGKRILSIAISSLGDTGSDKMQGGVAVLHDVTREHNAARMKTEFVANASHELRTPLGGIKAYLEMLTDGEVKDDQTRDRFYQVMQGEVERLSNLVDNILNIARIEAGIVKVAKEQVPLTAVVREVVEALRPHAGTAGITLTCEELPVYFHVHADKEMLRRAVFNLVSNALKYTPQGGSVTVQMHVDEAAGSVTVDVADTGVGIGEQDLPRLFQKFFRVESSKKMAKGTGLGLVLVKEVVENLHGGRVAVKSTPGKGSTFSVTLPLLMDKPLVQEKQLAAAAG